VARFKKGALRYLVNVGVLTTGFDAPQVDCVALLRPTMSPGDLAITQGVPMGSLRVGDVIVFSLILILMNFVVDVVYGFLDPRISYK